MFHMFHLWEKSYGNKKMSALGDFYSPWDFCLVVSQVEQSPWLKAEGAVKVRIGDETIMGYKGLKAKYNNI